MQRDFILVVGLSGSGKSTWTKAYGAQKTRLLGFDPKAEYPNVDYLTDPQDFIPGILNGEKQTFRHFTPYAEEIPLFTTTAYAAGNCTLIFEECAFVFQRGESIPEWLESPVFMGREPQLNLVLVAQRASRIPLDIRSQANRIVTFLQNDPADARAIAERIGIDYRDEVSQLPLHTCLDWAVGRGVDRYQVGAGAGVDIHPASDTMEDAAPSQPTKEP